jgi:hypothetical protein
MLGSHLNARLALQVMERSRPSCHASTAEDEVCMLFIMTIGLAGISIATSTPTAQTIISTEETRKFAYKYGACAVARHPRGASEAVLRNADSLTLTRRYSALADDNCLPTDSQIVFPGDFFIYALADALVARELATAPIPDLSKVPPLGRRSMPTFAHLRRKFGYDAALSAAYNAEVFGALDDYGECVVRQSPAKANALLMTEPESAAESDRFEALSPALLACTPEDKTLKLTKFLLRGTIALNYYRLAQATLHVPIH